MYVMIAQLITNFSTSFVCSKLTQNLLFHGFMFFAHRCCVFKTHMMHIYVGWNTFKCLKIFHLTYLCIICVLDTQHQCVKNTNSWKNNFCMIFTNKSWDGKFVMLAWCCVYNMNCKPICVHRIQDTLKTKRL
jgi:hypothetical protein